MKRILITFALLLACAGLAAAKELTAEELEQHLKDKNVFFLDVREPEEIEKLGSVPGYVNIPVKQLESRMSEVPKGKVIVTICQRGRRAATAEEMLTKAGYTVAGSCGLADYKGKRVHPKGKG